jgi:hypothetical protein
MSSFFHYTTEPKRYSIRSQGDRTARLHESSCHHVITSRDQSCDRSLTQSDPYKYPELKTIYSRALHTSRFEGVNYPVVNNYFHALTDIFLENSYPPDAILNVDKTDFALGTTLPSKVLITREDTRAFKKISGRQE